MESCNIDTDIYQGIVDYTQVITPSSTRNTSIDLEIIKCNLSVWYPHSLKLGAIFEITMILPNIEDSW